LPLEGYRVAVSTSVEDFYTHLSGWHPEHPNTPTFTSCSSQIIEIAVKKKRRRNQKYTLNRKRNEFCILLPSQTSLPQNFLKWEKEQASPFFPVEGEGSSLCIEYDIEKLILGKKAR